MFNSLNDKEKQIISLRFGLYDGKERSLGEIGRILCLTRERIRQIEDKALVKLRIKGSQLQSLIKNYNDEEYNIIHDEEELRKFRIKKIVKVDYNIYFNEILKVIEAIIKNFDELVIDSYIKSKWISILYKKKPIIDIYYRKQNFELYIENNETNREILKLFLVSKCAEIGDSEDKLFRKKRLKFFVAEEKLSDVVKELVKQLSLDKIDNN